MRRNTSGSELSSFGDPPSLRSVGRGAGSTASKAAAARTEAWVDDAARRLVSDPYAGSSEFSEIVLRQGATLTGDTLRRGFDITARKLQEMARSKSAQHRRASASACRVITNVIASGSVVADDVSVVKDFLLNTQRALGFALKLADTHDDVTTVASAVGDLLASPALGTTATELGISLAYQGMEWLCGSRVYQRHAGAELALQLARAGILPSLGQQLPDLLSALTQALGTDWETEGAVAAAAEAVFETLPLGDANTIKLADDFLGACISALARPEAMGAVFRCMTCVARPLKQRFKNHIHTSLSAALRCATSDRPAAYSALRLIESYVLQGFVNPQQVQSVFPCLLEAVRVSAAESTPAGQSPPPSPPVTPGRGGTPRWGEPDTPSVLSNSFLSEQLSEAGGGDSFFQSGAAGGNPARGGGGAGQQTLLLPQQPRAARGVSVGSSAGSAASGRSASEGRGAASAAATSGAPDATPRHPHGTHPICAAFDAITSIFETGLTQSVSRRDTVFAQLWVTSLEVMRSKGPGAVEAAGCAAALCLTAPSPPPSPFQLAPDTIATLCSLPVTTRLVSIVESLAAGQPHHRSALIETLLMQAAEGFKAGAPPPHPPPQPPHQAWGSPAASPQGIGQVGSDPEWEEPGLVLLGGPRSPTASRREGRMSGEWPGGARHSRRRGVHTGEEAVLVAGLEGLRSGSRIFRGGCCVPERDQLDLVEGSVIPLLRHGSQAVVQRAAELICFIAAAHPTSPLWAHPLSSVLAVAVGIPSPATRVGVWRAVDASAPALCPALSAPQCAHFVALALHDTVEGIRCTSLRTAVSVSRTSHLMPQSLRALLLSLWNQLQHSQDSLVQARAARSFGVAHSALLSCAPLLVPSLLRQAEVLDCFAGSLASAVPMCQAALFDLVAQLLSASELPASPATLQHLQETAASAIVGGRAHSIRPAAAALTAIVKRTGQVGAGLLAQHDGLLPRLLDCLKGGTDQDHQGARTAVMQLLGTLGALAPQAASPLLPSESERSDDIPWGRGLLHPKYRSYRVTRALLNILKSARLRVHHVGALRAIQVPLNLLGTVRVIPLSRELVPVFCQVADRGAASVAAEHSAGLIELRAAIKAIFFVLAMIPDNIDPAWLGDLTRVADHGICAGEASALQLLGVAAQGLGPAFAPAVEDTIGTLTGLVSTSSCETTAAAAVRCLMTIGPALLRPYCTLVSQHLCQCLSRLGPSPLLRYLCVEASVRLVIGSVGGTASAAPLLHSLCYVLSMLDEGGGAGPDGEQRGGQHRGVPAVSAASVGSMTTTPLYGFTHASAAVGSALAVPALNSVSGQDVWFATVHAIRQLSRTCDMLGGAAGLGSAFLFNARHEMESSALRLGISVSLARQAIEGSLPDSSSPSSAAGADALSLRQPPKGHGAPDTAEDPYSLDHAALRRALQGFSAPALWLDNLAQTLLGESPRAALCAASPVARGYPQLAYELFGPAFVAVCMEPSRLESRIRAEGGGSKDDEGKQKLTDLRRWADNAQVTKALLVDAVNDALMSDQLSGETAQRLLCLVECYERFEEGAAAGTEGGAPKRRGSRSPYLLTPLCLCKLAERCGLYAKALHWAEAAVLARTGVDVEACISLLKAYKNLGIDGADAGITAVLDERGDTTGQEPRLQEDLGKTDAALVHYIQEGDVEGVMRCYDRLGDWRGILDAGVANADDPLLAPYVARASWVLGNWGTLASAAQVIMAHQELSPALVRAGQAGLGLFYLAVVHTNGADFGKARDCIRKCRLSIDSELSACLAEGYTRSYDMLVSLQQLVELEEVIEFKERSIEEPDRAPGMLSRLKEIWRSRLESNLMDSTSLRGTLTQRSLLVPPQEDTEPWLWFIDACKKDSERRQAWDTLKMISGTDDLSVGYLVEARLPQVALAMLRYEFEESRRDASAIINDTLSLASSCAADHNAPLQAEALMAAARWGQVTPGFAPSDLMTALRPAIAIVEDSALAETLRGSVRSLLWQTWGSLHYDLACTAQNPVHAVEAMRAFTHCAHVSAEEVAVPMVLRILRLVFLYAKSGRVGQYAREHLRSVSASLWLRVVPQLVARLGGKGSAIAEDLLCFTAEVFPHAVVYSMLPRSTTHGAGQAGCSSVTPDTSTADVLAVVRQSSPHSATLVDQAYRLAQELSQCAILHFEKWRRALDEANVHYHHRPLDLLQPLLDELRDPPGTVDAVHFLETCSKALFGAESLWQRAPKHSPAERASMMRRGWDLCSNLYLTELKYMKKKVFDHGISLDRVAPWLSTSKGLALAVPGCAAEVDPPLILSFSQRLRALNTKTCPKRLSLTDTHGTTHDYLLKGHEDLRLDERVMQLLGLVNGMLRKGGERRQLSDIVRFPVVPVGRNVGLIGWVADADDLGRLVRQQRHISNHRCEDMIILKYLEIDDIKLWESQTQERRIKALEAVNSKTDGDDIHRDLWLGSTSSETWVQRRYAFTRSLAVMSIVGYVLGLGDRHMGNIMLQHTTGRVAHIDFGDCFDVARQRKTLAEKVPFRLTRQLRHATGVGGVKGLFRHVAEETLSELRKGKELVMAMLEAFVFDPLMQWRLSGGGGAAATRGAARAAAAAAVAICAAAAVPQMAPPPQQTTASTASNSADPTQHDPSKRCDPTAEVFMRENGEEEEEHDKSSEEEEEGAAAAPPPSPPGGGIGGAGSPHPILTMQCAAAKPRVEAGEGGGAARQGVRLEVAAEAAVPQQSQHSQSVPIAAPGKGRQPADFNEVYGIKLCGGAEEAAPDLNTVLEASLRESRMSVRAGNTHYLQEAAAGGAGGGDTHPAPPSGGLTTSNPQARAVVDRLLQKLTGEDTLLLPTAAPPGGGGGGGGAAAVPSGVGNGVAVGAAAAAPGNGGKLEPLSVEQQVGRLVDEATALPNLADGYRGWEPWL